MTRQAQLFGLTFRVVGDGDFQRLEHAHGTRRVGIQVVTDTELEYAHVDHAIRAGYANALAELANRRRRVAAATESAQRGHPRVIPAIHVLLVNQLLELALAGHGVVQVQAGKFVLTRMRRHRQIVQEPLVQRAVIFKFQGANRVGNALDGIRLAMGKVVARVHAPLVTGLVVMGVTDTIENRIAQVHVRRRHVDLRTQHLGAVGKLAGGHALELIQVFLNAALAERAVLARLGQAAAVLARLLWCQLANIGLACLDQLDGPGVQLIEVIGGVAHIAAPFKAKPLDVGLDRINVFLLFLRGVGVVKTQVTDTAKLPGQTEVKTDRLGVTNVQVTVRLRRKAGNNVTVLAAVQISLDDLAQKVAWGRGVGFVHKVGKTRSGDALGIRDYSGARTIAIVARP